MRFQTVNLKIYDAIRQTIFGYAVFQHTAEFVQCLEDCYIITTLNQVAGAGQTCRTTTNHSHFAFLCNGRLYFCGSSFLCATQTSLIGCKTLQVSNGNGLATSLEVDTSAFTLLFLRTNAATDCGQRTILADRCQSLTKLFGLYIFNKAWYVDSNGTTFHASRVGAVKAAMCFGHGLFYGITFVYFLAEFTGTKLSIAFGHILTLNGHAFLWRHLFAEVRTPSSIATFIFRFGLSCIIVEMSLETCYTLALL